MERRLLIGNAYSYSVKKDCSYLYMWMTSNWLERSNILIWCGKYSQRQCEISKDIVDNYRAMFESRIYAGATEKLPCSENLSISSRSYDKEGHVKKYVERY